MEEQSCDLFTFRWTCFGMVLRHYKMFPFLTPLILCVQALRDYHIAGKFGGEKVWRIWRMSTTPPN